MDHPVSGGSEPPDEVSVKAAVSHGWDRLKVFFWPLVGITLLMWVFQLPMQGGNVPVDAVPVAVAIGLGLFSALYGVFVLMPLSFGMSFVGYRASTGNQPAVRDLFEGFRHYWPAIGAGLLTFFIVVGGLILLIVPGIIFALKLVLVPYLVVVERKGPTDAVRESWQRTKGHLGTLFLFLLAAIGITIVGALLLFVGIFPAMALISVATAGLYRAISDRHAGKGLDELGEGVFEDTPRPAAGVGEG